MRKTYRNSKNAEYWHSRWESIAPDTAMTATDEYPLKFAIEAVSLLNQKTKPKILEAGCGNGRLLKYFHQRGYDITGIDFADIAINKLAKSDPNLNVRTDDITNLEDESAKYSLILAFGLYHNFEELDLKKAINETHRVLEPNGIVCASFRANNLQNYLNDFFNLKITAKKPLRAKPKENLYFHKLNLTASECKGLFENNGFEILRYRQVENMPLLYKFSTFRAKKQRIFSEEAARRDGYQLNLIGKILTLILKLCIPNQFFSLHVIIAKKRITASSPSRLENNPK